MTSDGSPQAATPPHPALAPVKDETLRLLMAEEEGDYIAERLIATRRGMAVAAITGALMPVIPTVLFWNEAALFERLAALHLAAGLAAFFATLAGIAAPFWAAVRIILGVRALRRYRTYQADHAAFMARHNRCPLDARRETGGLDG